MSIITQDDWLKSYERRQAVLLACLMEFLAVCILIFDAQIYPKLLPFAFLTYIMARLFGWHLRSSTAK